MTKHADYPEQHHSPTRVEPRCSTGGERTAYALLLRRISVRRSVLVALLLLVVLAVGGSITTLQAVSGGAFMLRRAETSYRQLSAYRELSSDVLEYMLETRDEAANPQRQLVEQRLTDLDALVAFEEGLVHDNGGDENDLVERRRLDRIHATIESIFTAAAPGALAATDHAEVAVYHQGLKPLLQDAVRGEQAEIMEVEASMRNLQARMRWLGRIGVLLQIATAALVFALVVKAVLDPLARLVADIKEIGHHRLGHRALVPRHDEFGLLAQHINRMASNLERGRRSLVEANNDLEATVADRTRSLQDRNEELREIDASRRRFFADVSHELRTPLTAIVGEADVTLRVATADAATCRQALSAILANSTYLNRRIDDLMALARSADGQLELQMAVVDLNLVAAEAMAEIRTLAKVNRVETRFTPLDAPVLVKGDRLRLRQSLMILLDNAVKFSRGEQDVDIVIGTRDARVDLTVVDRGRGIAVTELPRVFERYYQSDVGRRMGGTGLGLSIARRIVEAHDGTISADSNATGGTAITMTFALVEGAEPQPNQDLDL